MSKRLIFPALLLCSVVYTYYTHPTYPVARPVNPYCYSPPSDREITATLSTTPTPVRARQGLPTLPATPALNRATLATTLGKGGLPYPTLADRVARADAITTDIPIPMGMYTTVQGRDTGQGYTVQGSRVQGNTVQGSTFRPYSVQGSRVVLPLFRARGTGKGK